VIARGTLTTTVYLASWWYPTVRSSPMDPAAPRKGTKLKFNYEQRVNGFLLSVFSYLKTEIRQQKTVYVFPV